VPDLRRDYETAFLGAVLLNSDILASSILTDVMFTSRRGVYRILVALAAKTKIDGDDIPMLMGAGLDGVTITELTTAMASSANWEWYQTKIFEAWADDQLKSAFKMALSQGYPDCLDVVERTMTAVALRQTHGKTNHVRDILGPAFDRIRARMEARGKIPGISWGMSTIDECTLGAQAGQLVVIGARPSQGKSALMAQAARTMGTNGHNAGIVTIESSETELVIRMLGAEAKIDGRDLQTGMVGQTHIADLKFASDRLLDSKIVIHDQPNIRLGQLQQVVRKMARDHVEVVFIDYLQLIRVPGKERRMDEVGEACTSLKALARELNICIVAMAQLKRDADERRPNMGDFQHSSQIEQDADQAWLIWHKQDDAGNFTDSRIILAKVRDGQVRDVRVRFDRPTLSFYEIDNREGQ